jgi:translation elongation factor EF-1beta
MFEKLGFAIDKSSHDYHLFCERMSLQAAREFAAVVVEVHPESDEVDLKTLEVDVRGFGSGYGIVWGESRHVPIAFDVWKIVIAASYEVKPDVDVEFILEEELAETLSLVSRVEIISQNHL